VSIRDALERDVVRYFSEVAGRTRDRLERELKRAAPVRTGQTRDATSVSVRREGQGFRFTAQAETEYASFTSKPTRPHVIRAVRAKVLRFDWPEAGGIVYFPQVNHPGTRGTGWWERTLEAFPEVIRESF
jgi:hypothetical protein